MVYKAHTSEIRNCREQCAKQPYQRPDNTTIRPDLRNRRPDGGTVWYVAGGQPRRLVRAVCRRPAPTVRTAAASARREPTSTTSFFARVIAV
jgi:hypothetical protein